MTPDTWVIIGTVLVTNIGLFAWLRGDLARLSTRVDALAERMSRMEGKMDLLLQGLQIRITPKDPAS